MSSSFNFNLESLDSNIKNTLFPVQLESLCDVTQLLIMISSLISPFLKLYFSQKQRIKSFYGNPNYKDPQLVNTLSSKGFFSVSATSDWLECFMCRIRIADIQFIDSCSTIDHDHLTVSPHCPIVLLSQSMISEQPQKFQTWCHLTMNKLHDTVNKQSPHLMGTAEALGHKKETIFLTVAKRLMLNLRYPLENVAFNTSIQLIKAIIQFELLDRDKQFDLELYSSFMLYIQSNSKELFLSHRVEQPAPLIGTNENVIRKRKSRIENDQMFQNLEMIVKQICKQCNSKRANILCIPCRHISLCENCVGQNCPLCNQINKRQ